MNRCYAKFVDIAFVWNNFKTADGDVVDLSGLLLELKSDS